MTEPTHDIKQSYLATQGPVSRQGTFGAEDSSEGLVFGEVDDADVFSTPLSVTRASSRAAESPSLDGAFYSPPTSPPGLDQADASAGEQQAQPAASTAKAELDAPVAAADTQHANGSIDAQEAHTQAGDDAAEPLLVQSTAANTTTTADAAAADTLPGPSGNPDELLPVQSASQQVDTAAPDAAVPPVHTSGLLSLSELRIDSNSTQAASRVQPESPSSPSAVSVTSSSDTSMPTAADAINIPADTAAAGAGDGAVAADTAAASAAHDASVFNSSSSDSGHQAAGSSGRQLQESGLSLSPPCSPVAVHGGGGGGLERAASWQLQHAAAAAAGTAAHPAPPRSDMDLVKLSNTPASPHGESGWAAWQQRRRHFFVLTAAGKPVYSRHGDEQALAGFMAVIQALLSVMSDQGDIIHSITVGTSNLEFLLRGQLYLVAVSSRAEAQPALRRQLELLYQSILMVATGGIERLLTRSPGYDVQQLLAGAKPSMNALISAFGDCPGWMMASVEPAPTAAADRQLVTTALQEAVKACDCLYGILLVAGRVVAVERGSAAPPLNVFDLLLLTNFASSNESLRHNETFVPVCLPNFQPNAFVHAYVNCLDDAAALLQQQQQQQQQGSPQASQQDQQVLLQQQVQQSQQLQQQQQHPNSSPARGTFLLLLSGSADAFHKLSAAQQSFVGAVTAGPGGGLLARVQAAAVQPGRGRVRVEALPPPLGGSFGSTPLWHALIRYSQRHQHITLAYPQQLFSTRSQVKQLVRSYCRLYCDVYGQLLEANATATAPGPFGSGASSSGPGGSSTHAATAAAAAGKAAKLVWVTTQRWVTGVLADREVEVYVTLDPLTEKEVGLKVAETLKRLFGDKARRQDLLVPGL